MEITFAGVRLKVKHTKVSIMSHNYDNNKNNNFKSTDRIANVNDRISVEVIL